MRKAQYTFSDNVEKIWGSEREGDSMMTWNFDQSSELIGFYGSGDSGAVTDFGIYIFDNDECRPNGYTGFYFGEASSETVASGETLDQLDTFESDADGSNTEANL